MNNVIEERAVSDPEVAQFVRDEIAGIEASANAQLLDFKKAILEEHKRELKKSISDAVKGIEKKRLVSAYVKGIKKGFTAATMLFLGVSVIGYLVIV